MVASPARKKERIWPAIWPACLSDQTDNQTVFRKGVVVGQTQARMYTWEKSAKSGSATMLAKRVTLLYDIDNCRVPRVHVGGQLPFPGLTASEVGLVGQLVCLLVGWLVWVRPGWVVSFDTICLLVGWLVGWSGVPTWPSFPKCPSDPNLGSTARLA